MDIMMIGKNIAELRKAKGVKQDDVALLNGIDYPAFFKLMADPDVFNTLVFLYKRESENAFA